MEMEGKPDTHLPTCLYFNVLQIIVKVDQYAFQTSPGQKG